DEATAARLVSLRSLLQLQDERLVSWRGASQRRSQLPDRLRVSIQQMKHAARDGTSDDDPRQEALRLPDAVLVELRQSWNWSQYHLAVETVSSSDYCKVFVRVISCDFVDRLIRSEKSDQRNHTK